MLADQPPIIWQFHRFLLWQLLFHSYSDSLSFGTPGPGRSTSLLNSNFTNSSSTLKAHIWQTPCQMAISQIPVNLIFHSFSDSSTFHRPGLGRSDPLIKGNFTDSCSNLTAPHLADHVLADLPPVKWQFHRFHSSDSSYFIPTPERSYLADQVLADLLYIKVEIPQIPVKFLFHSYSKSSSFGRPGPDRTSPHPMVI